MDEFVSKSQLYRFIGQSGVARIHVADVDMMKPADVAPVVHGRWIFNDDWWEFRCTECHRAIGNIEKYNYCPHCGAKMDGGEKDAEVPT